MKYLIEVYNMKYYMNKKRVRIVNFYLTKIFRYLLKIRYYLR